MGREKEREREELPDRVTYIQHCLESKAEGEGERETERQKGMHRGSINRERADEIAGKKNEKERRRYRNQEKQKRVEAEKES